MKNLKNLFPEIKQDNDKKLLYKLEANLIYCDIRNRDKIASQIKMILNRRSDLKSEVLNNFIK